MSLFYPYMNLEKLRDVTARLLSGAGVTWLAVDLDNTLTLPDDRELPPENRDWLLEMRRAGIGLVVISNNSPERVGGFAGLWGLDWVAKAAKPSKKGLVRAAQIAGQPLNKGALVGDQIFTDVLAAKNAGMKMLLVRPLKTEDKGFLAFKRRLERLTKAGRERNL